MLVELTMHLQHMIFSSEKKYPKMIKNALEKTLKMLTNFIEVPISWKRRTLSRLLLSGFQMQFDINK